jgi:hypothetical protein
MLAWFPARRTPGTPTRLSISSEGSLQEHGLGLVPFGAQVDGVDRKEHIVEGIVDRPVVGGVVVNDQHIGVCQGDRDLDISQKISINDLGG